MIVVPRSIAIPTAFLLLGQLAGWPVTAGAQPASLPSPLGLADAIRMAGERRDELEAARALIRAAEQRPAIVSALDDPMVAPSFNHVPFMLDGADVSVTVEQAFPLSRVRRHRRTAALADVDRVRADRDRAALDVRVQAASAWLMVLERRRMQALVAEQLGFARDVVVAANARYGGGTAPQSDVLRAEVEVARLEAMARSLTSEVRGAEAMLNASLAVDVGSVVPPLAPLAFAEPAPLGSIVDAAVAGRPELAAGRAGIARAEADVQVMRDMYRPMMTLRTGPAYTMAQGTGWMAMVGVSLPIWRSKLAAGVAEAEAMRAMATADLRAMTRMVEGDAAAAASQLQAARDRQDALTRDVLPRARMAIQPAVAGYAAGQLPLVSVIEAVQALWLVQADLITADVEVGQAWARLGRATGSYEGILR